VTLVNPRLQPRDLGTKIKRGFSPNAAILLREYLIKINISTSIGLKPLFFIYHLTPA
jgi:hypothetical protein